MFLVFHQFLTICHIQIIIMIFAAGFFYTLYIFRPEPIHFSKFPYIFFFCCVSLLCCCCYHYCWRLEDIFLFVPHLSLRFSFLYSSEWFSLWLYTQWHIGNYEYYNILRTYPIFVCVWYKRRAKMPFPLSQSFRLIFVFFFSCSKIAKILYCVCVWNVSNVSMYAVDAVCFCQTICCQRELIFYFHVFFISLNEPNHRMIDQQNHRKWNWENEKMLRI